MQAWVVKTITQHGMTEVVPFNIRAKRNPDKTVPTPSLEKKLEMCASSCFVSYMYLNLSSLLNTVNFHPLQSIGTAKGRPWEGKYERDLATI